MPLRVFANYTCFSDAKHKIRIFSQPIVLEKREYRPLQAQTILAYRPKNI